MLLGSIRFKVKCHKKKKKIQYTGAGLGSFHFQFTAINKPEMWKIENKSSWTWSKRDALLKTMVSAHFITTLWIESGASKPIITKNWWWQQDCSYLESNASYFLFSKYSTYISDTLNSPLPFLPCFIRWMWMYKPMVSILLYLNMSFYLCYFFFSPLDPP